MKKVWKVTMAAGLLLGGIGIGSVFGVAASEAEPGTAQDPLATKSYVDEQVKALVQAELAANGSGANIDRGAANSLEVVDVKKGEKLVAKAGTEVIVRNGKALITSTDGNGVPDLTDGKDLKNGQSVPTNHLLSFPRDGRGVMPDPGQANGLILTVRGGYELVSVK
ncbi:hypothetical protein [Paenibacillus sp. 481]|uniref:hypothetical protein n=1 Tax=Paenibacillus sp. 481 TaxID=2835869 RepID=UPI001E4DD4F8|nr:hypothetical protein [Paenibacillus sp. 481]UHA75695.1 hypothetical protein KIK04_12290 [Paenibacillus sp. 481]